MLPLPSSSYQDAFDFLESLFTAHHNEHVSMSKVEKQSFANISQKPLHLSYLSQPLPVRRSNHSPALTLIVTLPLCFTTVLSLSAYPFICFFLMEFELSFNKKNPLSFYFHTAYLLTSGLCRLHFPGAAHHASLPFAFWANWHLDRET